MIYIRCAIVALLLSAPVVSASPAQADARMEELVDRVLNETETMRSLDIFMSEYAKEFLRSWKSTLQQTLDDETEALLLQDLTKRFTADYVAMLPKMREIYLSNFSVEELEAIDAFNSSAMGKSIQAKQSKVDREMAKILYEKINDLAVKHWNDAVTALRATGKKL